MGRGTTRRSPSDLTPSLLGIPYFTIHFASLSMILFAIKKRIFAKYQPLNLCSLTKPSPSPAAPQISAQPEPTPPRASPASPSPAGRSKAPAGARHAQRPGEGEKSQQERKHPAPRRPARRRRPSPATRRQPSRHRPAVPIFPAADRLQGTAAPAASSGNRRRQRRREGERRERPQHAQLQRLST